jgi:hypothetical protein
MTAFADAGNKRVLAGVSREAAVGVGHGAEEEVRELELFHGVGFDDLDAFDDGAVEIVEAVAEDLVKFVDLARAAGVLLVEVDAVAGIGAEDGFEEAEHHFVVPVVVGLAVVGVAEIGFVSDPGAEVEVVIVEEVVEDGAVEVGLCRGDFAPLDFEVGGESVLLFDLAEADGDFAGLVLEAPDAAENHDRLVVVFDVAAFVAVDVVGLGHRVGAGFIVGGLPLAIGGETARLCGTDSIRRVGGGC